MVGGGWWNDDYDDDDDALTVYCVAPVIAFPPIIMIIIIISTFRFAMVLLGTARYVCPDGHPRVVEPADDLSANLYIVRRVTRRRRSRYYILILLIYFRYRHCYVIDDGEDRCVRFDSRKIVLRFSHEPTYTI